VEEDKSSFQKTSLSSLDGAITRVNATKEFQAIAVPPEPTERSTQQLKSTGASMSPKSLFLKISRPSY
jgi:hypothetical protein